MSGEVCPDCQPILTAQQDRIAGLESTLRSQASKIGRLQREQKENLEDHEQWDRARRLFRVWQRATGHTKSKFTVKRFKLALPYLQTYEDEILVRAISGLAYDPMTRPMKNGLGDERFDSWETLFKNDAAVERHANRAPVAWRSTTLEEYVAEEAAAKGRQI